MSYGDLVRIETDGGSKPQIISRLPLGSDVASGGIDEATLQDILFGFPQAIPIADIDPAYSGAVPICKELGLPAGYADALHCNQMGRLTLSEFKLWRNPQARREVIGQILDYAKDLAGWDYEDLQRQVSLATGQRGNVLFDFVTKHHPKLDEAKFVDNVARHLRRGEFLLLIIGDGIREDAAGIVDYVQRHSGLHFNLAMVEAALYRDSAETLIVQPRVLARTEIVQRFVFGGDSPGDLTAHGADEPEPMSEQDQQNLRFWSAVVRDYSFSETNVEVPAATTDSTLYVLVKGSGFGGWALSLCGFLQRRGSGRMGCYLSARKDYLREVRIFEELGASLEELGEGAGSDLERWKNAAGRPRLGYRRSVDKEFLAEGEESETFKEAVTWMREHLDRLVSTLHPRLQERLQGGK